jgi:hypothetical protein
MFFLPSAHTHSKTTAKFSGKKDSLLSRRLHRTAQGFFFLEEFHLVLKHVKED